MKIPEKAREMIHYLEEKIVAGIFAENSRLPSLRVLMEQFQISYGSAKRGIDYLCEAGLVEIRSKSGVYVKRVTESGAVAENQITLIFSNNNYSMTRGIYATVFLGIQKAAAKENCRLMMDFLPLDELAEHDIQKKTKGADGVILMAEYDRVCNNLAFNIPTVGVFMKNSMNGHLSLLDIDPYDTAAKAVGYFKGKGLNEVVVVTEKVQSPAYATRAEIFMDMWQRQGSGYVVAVDNFTGDIDYSGSKGVFFTTGSVAQYAFDYYRRKHGKMDFSGLPLLGVDGKSLLDPEFDQIDTVTVNWQQAGKYVLEECLYRIKNPGSIPKRILLPGVLKQV